MNLEKQQKELSHARRDLARLEKAQAAGLRVDCAMRLLRRWITFQEKFLQAQVRA